MVKEGYDYIDYENKMKEWIQKRKESGMTQKEVADKLGTSYSMISYIESFKRRSYAAYYAYKNLFGGGE